jgi:APA family basic amino acid/polyamine antiporter
VRINELIRRKSLDRLREDAEKSGGLSLKRSLGPWDLTSLGIGAVIGAGIFAVIGTAAAGGSSGHGAGPAVTLSFVITAIACAFCAFCYAEFAAIVPIAGSAYTYSYSTLGEAAAWIVGWTLMLEYGIGNVAVAIGWSAYCDQLLEGLGVNVPAWLAVDWRTAHQAAGAALAAGGSVPSHMAKALEAWNTAPVIGGVHIIFNLLAFAVVALVTWILVIGIKESARFNNAMVALKLLILGFFIVVGALYVKPENWSPFMPNGFTGVWIGASLIFFAFIGFDAVSTAAEECRNPGRDVPIGIIASLGICTVIYVATAAVLTGIVPWNTLGVANPLSSAFSAIGLGWAAGIVSLGAVISMTAVLLVFQLGQPRIFFAMSRDGLLPKYFARVHPKFRTPHVTTLWSGVAVGSIAAVTNINEMVELTNIGTLFVFVLVCAGVVILRRTDPAAPRSFRTPLVPLIPLLGMAMCIYLMLGLPAATWLRFGLWLAAGLAVYFAYGYRNSLLKKRG